MPLTDEQNRVLEYIKRGNAVVTGAGGTGKSYILRELKNWADRENISVAVTSLTGAAALVLDIPGAMTLHKFAGVGLGKDPTRVAVARILKRPMAADKWRKTQLLLVDEVSMMSRKLFDHIDEVARAVRNRPKEPFGGMHVVAFGDFYQLAPVADRRDSTDEYGHPVTDPSGQFCFQSSNWWTMFPLHAHFTLTAMVRQKDDVEFQNVLSEIRVGKCSDEAAAFLRKCIRPRGAAGTAGTAGTGDSSPSGSTAVMKLFPTNKFVDEENALAYARVPGEEHVFNAETFTTLGKWMSDQSVFSGRDLAAVGRANKETRAQELVYFQKDIPCMERLPLKVGTAVFLLCNLDVENGLANGSQGEVVRFERMVPESVGGETTRRGGAVFDDDGIDDEINACVAAAAPSAATVSSVSSSIMAPVVRFRNGQERLIVPHWWQSPTLPCVGVLQVPLKHGWASSIHKSQGATYDEAEVDVGSNVFAPGQVYVALSRLRTRKGLHLLAFDRSKIIAHPAVVALYAKIAGAATTSAPATTSGIVTSAAPAAVAAPISGKKRPMTPPLAVAVKREKRSASIWGDDDDYNDEE